MPKRFLWIYLSLTVILLTNVICYLNWDISLRGYWTDRILFWVWFGLTFFAVIQFWKRKLIKIYFSLLVGVTILSMIPMLIPFLIIVFTITGQDIGCSQDLSSTIRIQEHSTSPVVSPKIEVIKKAGVIERVIGERDLQIELEGDYYRMCEANSIEIIDHSPHEIIVKFTFDAGDVDWKIEDINW